MSAFRSSSASPVSRCSINGCIRPDVAGQPPLCYGHITEMNDDLWPGWREHAPQPQVEWEVTEKRFHAWVKQRNEPQNRPVAGGGTG